MLKLLIEWVFFEPVLDLLEYVRENGLWRVFALKFIDNLEKWRLGHPVVDPNRFIEVTSLNRLYLHLWRRYL